MIDGFTIQTDTFQGPMDLLLNLIEEHKLHISKVSLAEVADEYIEYVQQQENIPTAHMAHFVLVASTLVLIKSKALLPTLELTKEEETEVSELEYRLKVYKLIKEASQILNKRFGKQMLFMHEEHAQNEDVFIPDETITSTTIRQAVANIIQEFPVAPALTRTVVENVMSLEDMIEQLHSRVKKAMKLHFSDMVQRGDTSREQKMNIATTFLALLELVKQQQVAVSQNGAFTDIEIQHSFEQVV